ncbi:MAG: hypothetical protein IT371_05350 [Deltaproteobacteria bacterium]|nr:hypothetical protein [Deltaproteobacteria bacterium]
MSTFRGTVRRNDLGGGAWTLISEQGVVYQLKGGGKDLLRDGVRAEVKGRLAAEQMGIAMVGEILEVQSYQVLGAKD